MPLASIVAIFEIDWSMRFETVKASRNAMIAHFIVGIGFVADAPCHESQIFMQILQSQLVGTRYGMSVCSILVFNGMGVGEEIV